MDKILSGEKSYEIRNSFLRCVAANEKFYLLRVFPIKDGDGRNKNGQRVVEIVGTAMFKGNHWIPHQSFNDFFQYHHVDPDQYDNMRKGWKRDTGGCVAWEISLEEALKHPRYLPSGPQDCLV